MDIFVIAYMDDILVFSENKGDHEKHMQLVLEALDKAHLRIKLKKCQFGVEKLEFLGHLVSTEGIEMAPSKVDQIKNWPTPQSAKNVQEFLGFCGFNRQFIRNYAKITIPLTNLTRKDTPFN